MSATLYWDPNGALTGRGGTGTWNTSSLFWDPNSGGVCAGPCQVWDNIALHDAVFGDANTGTGFAGTVTLGVPITVHNMTFESDNLAPLVATAYTITGSTLTLGGVNPTVNVASGTVTINSIVAGTAGLNKTGAGALVLTNTANTFSGGIAGSGGFLTFNGDSALGAASNNISLTGGGLNLTNTGTTDISSARTVTIASGAFAVLRNSSTGNVGAAKFTGAGGVSALNTVTMSNNANDYTGTTTLSGSGVVRFTSIADLGVASSLGAPITAANGLITVNTGGGSSTTASYIGDGDSSNRNWQLNTVAQGGAIAIANNGTGTLTLTGTIATSGGQNIVFAANSADLAVLGVVSGTRTFNFNGGAGQTITLGGANTYVGTSNINTVTVKAATLADTGIASSFGTSGTIAITGGTLSYTGGAASSNRDFIFAGAASIRNDGTGSLTLSGPMSVGSGSLTLGGSFAGVSTISSVISGAGGVVAGSTTNPSDPANVWVLSGINTYSGTTRVENGTLRAGSAQAFGVANPMVVNGGTLDLNANDITVASLAGTGGTIALGANTLTVKGTTSPGAYSGTITGTGGLTKLGTGTLTLAGANSYTGATNIGGGTLALNFAAAGAPATDIIAAGSTLNMSGGTLAATGADNEDNVQTFNGLNVIAGSNKVNATAGAVAGESMTIDLGAINRTGGLVDFGIGTGGVIHTDNAQGFLGGWATVTVNNVTNYAEVDAAGNIVAFADYDDKDVADTWVDGDVVSDDDGDAQTFSGTVVAAGDTDADGKVELGGLQYTVNANSSVSVGAGQILSIDGSILVSSQVGASTKAISGPGALTGGPNGGTLGILHNGTGNFTISAQIIDNGGATSFVKGGTGTVILNNNTSNYTGATILSSGTLSVTSIGNGGAASAIGASDAASSNLVLENGTLIYTGGTATTDRGFTLVNGGPSRVMQINGAANLTFDGVVVSPDGAGFTKTGTGTLTLANNANTYGGVTRIESGILSVDTLANGGLDSGIGNSGPGSANLVLATIGAGSTTGTLQYTGGTVTSDRGFTLESGAGGIDVSQLATTLTFSGAAVGGGSLVKSGAGILVLSGTNIYTGGTTVSAGTLRAGSTRAFGGTDANGTGAGVMDVAGGATLDLANFNNTVGGLIGSGTVTLGTATLRINNNGNAFSGTISGTGGVTIAAGTQVMTGCNNTYTGVTTLNGATLSTDCLKNGDVASGIGASGAASANLVLVNGALLYTGANETIDRGFTIAGNSGVTGAINVSQLATTLQIGGAVVGPGQLVKQGPGTLVLTGTNSYTGVTTIQGGILRAGSTSAIGTNGVRFSNVAGAGLELNGFNTTVAWLDDGGASGGNIDLGGATLTINPGTATAGIAYAGAITGAGNLVKSGDDIQRLSGCNSSYTGTTTINGTNASAVLEVSCLANGGANSSIGMSGSEASNLVLNGGTLRYIGTGDSTDRLFSLGSSATSALDASGTGALHFTNTGAIAFTSPNTAQTVTLTGGSAVSLENTFALQITNNSTGATGLTKTGSNFWTLENQTSSYTGVTRILGGVLGVDKLADGGLNSSIGASLGIAANLVIGSGATLRYTGTGDTTNRLFTLETGTTNIESSGTGAIVFSNTGDVVLTTPNTARTISLGGTNTGLNIMGGRITNAGTGVTTLVKNGTGTWVLTGNNTFTGNTTINGGNLIVGDPSINGGTTGNVGSGNVIVNSPTSVLSFNRSNAFDVTGLISGTGSIAQIGTGTTTLTRNNSYTGTTTVSAGTLLINGDQTSATGLTSVTGGALGGTGTIGGAVTVANGATLKPGSNANGGVGTLTIKGALTLNSTSILDYQFGQAGTVGGAQNDHLVVNDALTLDGQLNVTQSPNGTFGPGVYRIITYTAGITNNGLTSSNPDFYVQTSIGGQVNLVNTAGAVLNFWDGQIVAQKNNNVVNGGDGTWQGSGGNDNWTIASGQFNAPFDTAAIAIFGGVAGTVTVDNDAVTGDVIASGMQFLTTGYLIQGETITLVPNSANPGQSVITVGDGTLAGAGITATISAVLTGNTQLVKADLGTLILSGANSYTGGTAINGGVLQIANDGNLGLANTALSFNTGTLRNTGVIATSRAVTLNAGGGTFETLANLTLDGAIGGAGALTKTGASTLILTADNTYGGGTTISAGTLQLGNNAGGSTTGSITGPVVNNAALAFNRSNEYTFAGLISGSGVVEQIGTGTTILTADNTYTGGTTISAGTLQLGNGGTTGSILGDVVNDGTLAINHSDEYEFTGVISGVGGLRQIGSGTTILAGANSYDGPTLVETGTLLVNGNQSGADGDTSVFNGATLGGIGTIGGNVTVADGGTLSPGLAGNVPGTLTIEGNLVLNSTSNLNVNFGQANVVGGQFNDHIVVGGALTLDGTLNVTETPGGNFGPGIYRVISYDATDGFTDNGLAFSNPNFTVQTSISGQVNLINSAGLPLNYWDGDAGPINNSIVNGGDGTWRNASDDNWTDQNGTVNSDYADGAFAIFAGDFGTVMVNHDQGIVEAQGMQFATDGYIIGGESINLIGPTSIIRVGDGTAVGADFVATIYSDLTGTTQLVKTDLGTLVLTGTNTYSDGTAINGGVLQVSADANLGALAGDLNFDTGTLRNTSAFASDRDATLDAGGGTFETGANLTWNGIIDGEGNLTKIGTAALILTGANAYTGTTTVSAGSLIVDGDQSAATGDTIVNSAATIGGSGTIGGNVTVESGGTLAPGGLTGIGVGTLTIAGNLTLDAGASLNYSFGDGAVGGPAAPGGGDYNDLVNVDGNLILDGTLNVTETAGGSFGPGIYRVFNYEGTLTDNGLELGSMPTGNFTVQTSQTGQVNLVNTAGLTLNYWDGNDGPINNGVVNGGDGTWRAAGDDNWTDQDGNVNAAYANGSVAIFMGTPGTVTVDNSAPNGQVIASGMQFAVDGYLVTGGAIQLDGATIRVGDGNVSSASYVATISSVLTGTGLTKDDYGTLVLTGQNTYIGGTVIARGTLQVSEDANLGDAANDLAMANNGTLHTTASFSTGRDMVFSSGGGTLLTDDATILTVNGVLSGPGNFTKAGTGKVVLTADSSAYTATTDIDAGTLTVNGSLCGHVNVNDGGRLEGTGTVCDTTNFAGGTIAPGDGGIGTLTVDGDYTGGGLLEIETVLGDDTSDTDLLRVTGNTSGTTVVTVDNLGGGGAQTVEGIKIVDIGATSAGVFALDGDYVFQGEQAVVAGAYSYVLRKNGVSTPQDGDWYLRSSLTDDPGPGEPPSPIYSPAVPMYEAFAAILQDFDELETLQRRIGNRQWLGKETIEPAADVLGPSTGEKSDRIGVWARIKAGHAHLEPDKASTVDDYDVTSWKIQGGADALLSDSDAGSLIGGLALHFGTASASIDSFFGNGDIDVTGYGISGTLTWYGSGGFYVDTQAQASLYDSDLSSDEVGELADGADGWGYALSIESGQKLPISSHWSLTPQAQLTYAEVDFDDFTDPFDGDVSLEDSDTLIGRLGLSADYESEWQDEKGQASRAHLYGISSIYYDFLDGTEVDVSGTSFFLENEDLWGSAGLGGSLAWADDKYAVYGEALAKTSLEAFSDSYSVSGTVGFRVQW